MAGAVNMFGHARSWPGTRWPAPGGIATTLAVLLSVVVVHPPRSQQAVADFYPGQQLEMGIGYSPRGTHDLFSPPGAPVLRNYISGKPLIVPRNMPGAGRPA